MELKNIKQSIIDDIRKNMPTISWLFENDKLGKFRTTQLLDALGSRNLEEIDVFMKLEGGIFSSIKVKDKTLVL